MDMLRQPTPMKPRGGFGLGKSRRTNRRHAVNINLPRRFEMPREELEMALEQFRGPYGQIAEVDRPVRDAIAAAAGLP